MGSHPLLVTPDPTHTQLWFETQPEGFTRSVCFLCIDQPVGYTAWSQLTLDTTHCLLICRGQKLLEHASQTLLRQNQHSDGHTCMLSLSLEVKMVTCIFARWTPAQCRNYPWETSRTFLSCWSKWMNHVENVDTVDNYDYSIFMFYVA